MSTKPTVAILGGTAHTGLAVLTSLLEASYPVRALARSPAKLDVLVQKYPSLLTVVPGDARTPQVVKDTVYDSANKKVADVVVSTIGSLPGQNRTSFGNILGVDLTICQDAMNLILSSLKEATEELGDADMELKEKKKPLIIALSSTGISSKGRDIPLAMVPFYHILLATPHRDKKAVEAALEKGWDDWVIIRPSFFAGADEKGLNHVRVGIEGEKVDKHGIGYFVGRKDVAKWMVETLILPGEPDRKYHNKKVVLTY